MNSLVIEKTANYFKQKGIVLPTISELQNPHLIDTDIKNKVSKTDKDAMDPANLFRVHWFNKSDHTNFLDVPEHIILPDEFTGIEAKIIVNLGRYFPLITAHKVLAAYGCLLPRILNGTFDYSKHKAVWPSTGNYCRGESRKTLQRGSRQETRIHEKNPVGQSRSQQGKYFQANKP